jgi:hypothetical protein
MGGITPIPNIKQAFEGTRLRIPIAQLQPLKLITPATKKTLKYLQIAASVREVGIVEPPAVARDRDDPSKFSNPRWTHADRGPQGPR